MSAGGLLYFRIVSTIVQIAAFSSGNAPTPNLVLALGHLITAPRVSCRFPAEGTRKARVEEEVGLPEHIHLRNSMFTRMCPNESWSHCVG